MRKSQAGERGATNDLVRVFSVDADTSVVSEAASQSFYLSASITGRVGIGSTHAFSG